MDANIHRYLGGVGMKTGMLFGVASLLLFPMLSMASESLAMGTVSSLTSRSGWMTFRVMSNGVNLCEPCPVDPGARGYSRCWVDQADKSRVALLLTAQATGKKIYGRVTSYSTNCEVYQLSIED